jgi:hypothetical protein
MWVQVLLAEFERTDLMPKMAVWLYKGIPLPLIKMREMGIQIICQNASPVTIVL